ADAAQLLEVAPRRYDDAGRALYRLDDDGGDGGRIMLGKKASLELASELDAVLGQAPRERVALDVERVPQMVDARQQRPEALAVRGNPTDRDPSEVDPVIAALATDQARALRLAAHALIGHRDLQRGIDRLGSGVREEHPVEAGWRELRDSLRRLERLGMRHLERGREVELGDLLLY